MLKFTPLLVLYSLSMTIAVAAPPPLQIAATPFSPFFSAWTKVTTTRDPDEPIGWKYISYTI